MTNDQVSKLFEQWNEALINKDLTAITELYADDATLLPTNLLLETFIFNKIA